MKNWWLCGLVCALLGIAGCQSARESKFSGTLQEYLGDIRSSLPEEAANLSGVNYLKWSRESKYRILYSSQKYVSFEEKSWQYSGGAHGMTLTTVGTIAVADGHLLTLTELFPTPVARQKLRQLWQRALARHFKAPSFDACLKQQLLWNPELTENFYLDDRGLHMIYNPYDIACYAAGTIQVVIPWSELGQNFLK